MALGGTGYAIHVKNGLPKRFPKKIRKLQNILIKGNKTNDGFHTPCHTASGGILNNYKSCRDLTKNYLDKNKKTIVIWGDSHGTHLMPGLRKFLGSNFNLIQRTRCSCPAILTGETIGKKDVCKEQNRIVLDEIIKIKPDNVLLVGFWDVHGYKSLKVTIDYLRKYGIRNITLLGSAPSYKDKVPKILARFWINNGHFQKYVDDFEDKNRSKDVDEYMKILSKNLKLNFYFIIRHGQ